MLRSTVRSESGSALLTALFASLVLGALVVIFVGNAVSQSRASAASQGFEQTLHVSETATDVAFARLADNRDYFTTTASVTGNERTWAINQADLAVGASCEHAVRVGQGDAIPVVPRRNSWMDATTVYGVGYLPDCQTRKTVRVIKMELVSEPVQSYNPASAIVSGGDVNLEKNVKVTGGVHANGKLTYGGNSGSVDDATASTCGANATSKIDCTSEPMVDVIALRAREFWEKRTNPSVDLSVTWYDLCENGNIYVPLASDTQPCQGALLPTPTLPKPIGWTFVSSTRTWTHSGNTLPDGVYYAVNANLRVVDNPQGGRASFFAEGKVSELKTGIGNKSGSVTIDKNPKVTPVWPGVGIVADVDIAIENNGAYDGTQAMMYAREQIRWRNNHKTSGVFFIACDESLGSQWTENNPDSKWCPAPGAAGSHNSTELSPVHTNPSESISMQNMDIAFTDQGTTLIPGSDDLSVARWQEIR
jgi:hypothetical protein